MTAAAGLQKWYRKPYGRIPVAWFASNSECLNETPGYWKNLASNILTLIFGRALQPEIFFFGNLGNRLSRHGYTHYG